MSHAKKTALAPLFMVLSALSFAGMSAAVKQADQIPFLQKVFFRNAVMALTVLPVLVVRQRKTGPEVFLGNRGNRGKLLLRSLLGFTGVILYFYSVERLYLADSAMLNKLSAFFVMILAAIFLKERIKGYQIPALIAAFAGALLIIKPGFSMQLIPALAGAAASVIAAGAYTTIASLRGEESTFTIIFWFSGISTAALLIPTLIVWKQPSVTELLTLLLTGVFASGGQFFLTLAYSHGPPGEVSIYNYTNVLFSGLIGFFLWREIPDMLSGAGAVLIIGAAVSLYIVSRRRKNPPQEK